MTIARALSEILPKTFWSLFFWTHCIFGHVSVRFFLRLFPVDMAVFVTVVVLLICILTVVTTLYPRAVLCVLGNFNQLDTTFLLCDFGLTLLVNAPTHGNNLLDKVFINVPDGFN